jgi:hypothetical protein
MGGSAVAFATGIDAIFWNPAGAASIEGIDVMLSRRKYIADIDVDYIAVGKRMGDAGVMSITAKILSMGDEMVTTVNAPNGTGATFSGSFSVIGASYSRQFTDRVSVGVAGNVIYEKIADQTATGFALDVGAVVKNLGPKMKFDGGGFDVESDVGSDPNALPHKTRTQSEGFEIPSYFQLGMAYKMIDQEKSVVNLTGTFQSNNFAQDEYRVGGEFGFDNRFFLRGGYTYADQTDYLFGLTLGAGFAFDLGETAMSFDYAWSQSEYFDDNHYLTFQVGF